jgi:hypothetical protein
MPCDDATLLDIARAAWLIVEFRQGIDVVLKEPGWPYSPIPARKLRRYF